MHLIGNRLHVGGIVAAVFCTCGLSAAPVRLAATVEDGVMFGQGLRTSAALHILASPGPLSIRICKRDLNIYAGPDVLTVRVVSPDRRVIETLSFPDDGSTERSGMGPVQIAETVVNVETPGLWKVDLESWASGSDLVYGVETSADRYVFESPLLFKVPSLAGDIVFPAPPDGVSVEVEPQATAQTITVHDAGDGVVHTFDLDGKAPKATFATEPGTPVDGLWRVHIRKKQLRVTIPGVTTFAAGGSQKYYPQLPYWTDRRSAWFNAHDLRWVMQPLRRHLYREPGGTFEWSLTVYNGAAEARRIRLTADSMSAGCRIGFADANGSDWSAEVPAGGEMNVMLRGAIPGIARPADTYAFRVRAVVGEDAGYTTYAGLEVTVGEAPAEELLDMPIRLQPYAHENALFGYEPDYVTNAPYFDPDNRAVIRWRSAHRHHSTAVQVLENDQWRHADYRDALERAVPGFSGTYFAAYSLGVKTAFDQDGDAYTLISALGQAGRQAVLLHSGDGMHTWRGYGIGEPKGASFEIEQFTGHNPASGPPPVLLYTPGRSHEGRWATYNDLRLYLPRKTANGDLQPGEGLLISDRCIGVAAHSGGAAASVTRGGKTHVVWGEVVDAGETAPGVPTYIATYDHETGTLGEALLLAYGPPLNDVHNSPGIVADSKGFLHVVTGAHGKPFTYCRSLEPDNAYGGWTEPVPVLRSGRRDSGADDQGRGEQTYLGLVCTPDDTLHIVYRQWRANVDPDFSGRLYAALSHQRKPAAGDWEEPRVLIVPPLPDYSVYYHKITVDLLGRLFVGYSYFSVHSHYRHDVAGRLDYQAVIMSPDSGESWRLARTRDFADGHRRFRQRRNALP